MDGSVERGREATLESAVVTIAEALVRDFDVNDIFGLLIDGCVDLLGASAAGVMVVDREGRLQVVSSSTEAMHELETLELTHGEGPCLECYATGDAIVADLNDDAALHRWPRFTAEARAVGFAVAQALPMRIRDETIGALNVFRRTPQALADRDTALAQALADVATIAILQRRAMASSELLAEQLQAALNDRIVIEQVKGLLAERGQLGLDDAFALLRAYCRAERLPLTRTAREIINGVRDPDEVLAFRWPTLPGEN